MMICVVIKGPTYEAAEQQMMQAVKDADLVELRLDCFTSLDMSLLRLLCSSFSIPMIFTLRSAKQGGQYLLSEEQRMADLLSLLALKPQYVDVEHDLPPRFLQEIFFEYPDTQLILSHHDFIKTPQDLDELYRAIKQTPANVYKIAVMANTCIDAMRFICWAKQQEDQTLIAISMGDHGQISRILGPLIASPWTYAALDEDQMVAPGQLPVKKLIERYHYRLMTQETAVYGLIGDPVTVSISDETHNASIRTFGLDAVYVKMQVRSDELAQFLNLAKQLPFAGLSVTMPLKESILPFLDHIDERAKSMGAVNTLLFKEGKIFGFNTDGMGALNAIEQNSVVRGKTIIIIGAGGSAKAIAFEAMERGGHVIIVNRDKAKALKMAGSFGCIAKALDEMTVCCELGYDILINSTPSFMPIDPNDILPKTIVMDIKTKPKDIAFLQAAKEKRCSLVYGYQMFIEQALGQFQLWFKDSIDVSEGRKVLEAKVRDALH